MICAIATDVIGVSDVIHLAKPFFGDEEKQAVMDVLDSGMIASGAAVEEFQSKFTRYCGVKYGIAASSGTTALEVMLRAAGIGNGDKVLTTPFSFIASTNCILYTGAMPVFADIDPHTFNISPETVEEKLKTDPDVRAILIVHLFGHPCDMDAFVTLAEKYDVLLFEDCAQAHGALYKGKKAGSFGCASAFSFYPTKNMTTSEGGIVVTDNEDLAERAKLLINHGMKVRYYHDEIGYNYRMTNIAAAIGLRQLEKLEGFNQKRGEIASFYGNEIHNPLVSHPVSQSYGSHCFHQYSILVFDGKRDALVKHLNDKKIACGVFYPVSIPEQACYRHMNFETDFTVTDKIKKEILSLPMHPQLTEEDLCAVAEAVNQFQ